MNYIEILGKVTALFCFRFSGKGTLLVNARLFKQRRPFHGAMKQKSSSFPF